MTAVLIGVLVLQLGADLPISLVPRLGRGTERHFKPVAHLRDRLELAGSMRPRRPICQRLIFAVAFLGTKMPATRDIIGDRQANLSQRSSPPYKSVKLLKAGSMSTPVEATLTGQIRP